MKCISCWSVGSIALLAAVSGTALVGFAPARSEAPVTSPAPAATNFEVDSVHSAVVFKIQHAGVSNFYGTFQKMTGSFTWDKASPESATFTASIDAGSVSTGNPARDEHLRKPDFFNAKEQPNITFKSTGIKKTGDNAFDLTGDVTLLGKTKPVTAKVVFTGEKDAGPQFGYRAGFDITFSIKRSDFGMTYGVANGALSDEVSVTIGLAGVRK